MLYVDRHMLFLPLVLVTEDEELLAAARRLDSRALAAIHDRYYGDLYRFLLYRTGDAHTAEDLSSEVFMRLLDSLHKGRAPDSLRAWLFGVASHLTADHFRRQSRRPQSELNDELPAPEPGLDSEISNLFTAQAVRQALQQLTQEQQQVLALRFSEGRSVADTATVMQKSVTAVKQLQFRAVAALRRLLETSQAATEAET
jgi:RNA polymerase sigma-70 factor (ECF subfamily)